MGLKFSVKICQSYVYILWGCNGTLSLVELRSYGYGHGHDGTLAGRLALVIECLDLINEHVCMLLIKMLPCTFGNESWSDI